MGLYDYLQCSGCIALFVLLLFRDEFTKIGRFRTPLSVWLLLFAACQYCIFQANTEIFSCRKPNFELRSFAEGYCSANLNFIIVHDEIQFPVIFGVDKGDGEPLDYYFYIPLILVLQAMALWLPHLIWKWSQSDLEYRLDYIYKKAMNKAFRIPVKERLEESVVKVTTTVKKYQIITKSSPFRGLKFFQLHIMSKLLSILVLILQLAGMSYYFGRNESPYWGFSLIYNIAFVPSLKSGIFPVYTYCNLTRVVDNDEPVKFVLCELWLNNFNASLFFCIWIWFVWLLIINIGFVLYFAIGIKKGCFWFDSIHNFREMLIYQIFYTKNPKFIASKDEIESVDKFINDFLGVDGVYLMQLIRLDGGELVTSQICEGLYELYIEGFIVNDTSEKTET
uniref:Innexin n=1 Tax=Panagrellus redivivus TaxID=6233 RepID=A0A7E4WDE2_PANRE